MTDLTGKGAVVTGASRGIGAATTRVLAGAGAHVVLAARTGSEIEQVADEIRAAGGAASTAICDVTDYAAFEAAVAACEDTAGQLDILVNNAGVIDPIGHLADSDPEAWVHAAAINYKSVYYGLRIALPRMKAHGAGTIINISSGAAHSPLEGWSHYCSAKAGAHMLTRCADKECREAGVTVMGLSPGTVATYMQEAISASGINPVSQLDWSAHIPADWPARAILWLCGPDGAAFAGEEVSLRDEGIRARVGLTA
jgi:NAD(P)-dependent dehydrogenase (short-subunit alcohol dehydrogenase family)